MQTSCPVSRFARLMREGVPRINGAGVEKHPQRCVFSNVQRKFQAFAFQARYRTRRGIRHSIAKATEIRVCK